MTHRAHGRTAVVTGASAGIGEHTARLLAREGAHVALVARSEERLDTLAAELTEAGGMVIAVPADLSTDTGRGSMVARVVERLGPVEILVNNAGYGRYAPADDTDPEDVRGMFDLNVLAAIDLCRLVVPGMRRRGFGRVVNVGSLAGHIAAEPLTVYAATKHALVGFSEGLHRELRADRDVAVSLVSPGPVRTEFGQTASGLPVRPHRVPGGVEAERVAAAINRVIDRPRREVFVPAHHRIAARLAGLVPAIADAGAAYRGRTWERRLARARRESGD